MKKNIKVSALDWDTNFFGIPIGSIEIDDSSSFDSAKNILNNESEKKYKLIYVFADKKNKELNNKIKDSFGESISSKVYYEYDVKKLLNGHNSDKNIEIFKEMTPTKELLKLGLESGEFSRFKKDNKLDQKDFIRLYNEWVSKSVSGNIADMTVVYKDKNKIVGFITLKIIENIIEIGLLAVDGIYRKMKIGTKLMNWVQEYALKNHFKKILVPTQIDNEAACRFYEKLGFLVKSEKIIYHLWRKL